MIKRIEKTTRKKGVKKFCNKCHQLTPSSNTKQIFKGNKATSFYICLCCGEPYDYKSYKDLFLHIYKFKKPKVKSNLEDYKKSSRVIFIKKKRRIDLE